MTTPEALNALADRVEREEPSRALDLEIEKALRGIMALQTYPPYYSDYPARTAAALRARAADMQARAEDGAPHPAPTA